MHIVLLRVPYLHFPNHCFSVWLISSPAVPVRRWSASVTFIGGTTIASPTGIIRGIITALAVLLPVFYAPKRTASHSTYFETFFLASSGVVLGTFGTAPLTVAMATAVHRHVIRVIIVIVEYSIQVARVLEEVITKVVIHSKAIIAVKIIHGGRVHVALRMA